MKKINLQKQISNFDKANATSVLPDDKDAIIDSMKEGASAEEAVSSVYAEVYRPIVEQDALDRQYAQYYADAVEQDENVAEADKAAAVEAAKQMAAQMADRANQRDYKIKTYVETMLDYAGRLNPYTEEDFENGLPAGYYEFNPHFFEIELPIGTVLEDDAQNIYDMMRKGTAYDDAVCIVWSRTYSAAYDEAYNKAASKNAQVREEYREKKNRLLTYHQSMTTFAKQLSKEIAPYLEVLKEYSTPATLEPEGVLELTPAGMALINKYSADVDYQKMVDKAIEIYNGLVEEKGKDLRLADFMHAANEGLDFIPEEARATFAKGLYINLKSGELQKADEEFKRAQAEAEENKAAAIEEEEIPTVSIITSALDEEPANDEEKIPTISSVVGEPAVDAPEVPLGVTAEEFAALVDDLTSEPAVEGGEPAVEGEVPAVEGGESETEEPEAKPATVYEFNGVEKKWFAENLGLDTDAAIAQYVEENGGYGVVRGAIKMIIKADQKVKNEAKKGGKPATEPGV